MKNRVQELRKAKGLTQEQLGEIIGVSRQTINAIEREVRSEFTHRIQNGRDFQPTD